MNQTKRSIMRQLIDAGHTGLTPHELRSLTGLSQGRVSAALSELCRARVIEQGWRGLYARRAYRPAPLLLGSVRGFLEGAPPAPILPWHALSDAQEEAARWLLRQEGGEGLCSDMASEQSILPQATHDALSDLCDAGYAVRVGRGRYRATEGWEMPQEAPTAPTPVAPVVESPQQEEGTMEISMVLERVTASVELSLYQDGAEIFLTLQEDGGDVEHGYSFAVSPAEARELHAQLSAALKALEAWEAA